MGVIPSFRVSVRCNGRSREMGSGGYPDMGLAEARDQAAEYRKQAKAGLDPIEARAKAQAETEKMPTFTTCAARYILAHPSGWKNIKDDAGVGGVCDQGAGDREQLTDG